MTRPTKHNKEIAEEGVKLVKQGYNLRAAAQANNISEASISRWRDRYANFNKAVVLITKEQNDNACRLSGIRPYKRQAYISPQYNPRPLTSRQVLSEEKVRRQPQTWLGLPIKPQPLKYEPTDPYLNPNTHYAEWIDKNGMFHTCAMWVWEEKHRPKPYSIGLLDCFF